MDYVVSGPHNIPTKTIAKGIKHLDLSDEAIKCFWDKAGEEKNLSIESAVGCYVYAVRAGQGITPWYIGQAKESFGQEAFSYRNFKIFKQHFDEKINKGTPVIFFVIRQTPGGKLQAKYDVTEANWVEDYLIRRGLDKNPDLLNKKNTRHFTNVVIPGIHNAKAKTTADKELQKVFGMAGPYGFTKSTGKFLKQKA